MQQVPGVCVFDIDGTLKSFKSQHVPKQYTYAYVANAVQQCIAHGYGLAINTARFRLSSRLRRYLLQLGIDVNGLPPGAVQTKAYTAKRKARAMDMIAWVYHLPPDRLVLYDNKESIVRQVLQHGYRAVNVQQYGMVNPAIVFAS